MLDSSLDETRSAVIDLQSAMDLDSVWRNSLKLMRQELPLRSCSLFFGIVDFEPTAAVHHVESPRNPAYVPATSLTVSAPYLERHRRVQLYTYSQIVSEDPDAQRRRSEQEADPEWNEFVHLAFWRDERPEAVFSVTRAADQPGISRAERGLLTELHAMLDAGLRRIRAVEEIHARRHAYEACLQRMPVATLLTDEDGTLLFATAAGERLLAHWNQGLEAAGERLLADRVAQDFRKQRVRLAHPWIDGLSATIERNPAGATEGGRAGCIISFSEAATADAGTQDTAPEVLRTLSPSELRVAQLVARGLGNAEIAQQLGRSRRTIEFQLNTVYRKLGLSRRAQLVRLLG